ncbi:MAG: DUF1810 domain-containing protein [Marinibacterium sp.]
MAFDPVRFLLAQDPVWDDVLGELARGHKTSHWMWFVFPQLGSLGRSETARHYGLGGVEDARDWLAHSILGPRLRQVSDMILIHAGTAPEDILGPVDAIKLRSSMTLFSAAATGPEPFGKVLAAFYGGTTCPLTLAEIGTA